MRAWLKSAALRRFGRVFVFSGGFVLPLIYFLGESAQGTIDQSFGIPAGLINLSAGEKFVLGVGALLRAHFATVVILTILAPMLVGAVMLLRSVSVSIWRRLSPKWRLRLMTWSESAWSRIKGWLKTPEFYWLTMPFTSALAMGSMWTAVYGLSALLGEGITAGRVDAQELHLAASRCARSLAYTDDPECSILQLKSGATLRGLLLRTSGSQYYLSDGARTRIIDTANVDWISHVQRRTKRPHSPAKPARPRPGG